MNIKSPLFLLNSEEHFLKVFEESKQYLIDHKDIAKEINDRFWVINELQTLIPETIEKFWSGHIFPYTELQYEIDASIAFCLQGFYKHAIIALRNALELGLMSVYWDIDDDSEIKIQDWLKSIEDTPFRKNISKRLLQHPNFSIFNNKVNLINYIDNLYGFLSDYSHTKGARFSSRGLGNSNVNTFSEKSLLKWLNLYKQTVQIIAAVHICKYPVGFQFTPMDEKFGLNGPMGGFLNPHEADHIRQILPATWNKVLQEISNNDQRALDAADWVNRQPDITEEEFDQQIEKQDKDIIPHYAGGFKGWLKNEEKDLLFLKDNPDQYKKKKEYIEKMRKWAKEEKLI